LHFFATVNPRVFGYVLKKMKRLLRALNRMPLWINWLLLFALTYMTA